MSFVTNLRKKFEAKANDENAAAQKAYMKNHFEFFGMKTKERDEISKQYIKDFGFINAFELEKLVKELYNQPERDFHYVAIDVVAFHKKHWTVDTIKLIEYLLITNSWWDSVDDINSRIIGFYFKKFPQQIIPITTKWNLSNNMWLQRISIIFQLRLKQQTNTEILSKHILHCSASKEFFLQKAIGWALRDFADTNPNWVLDFVDKHPLAPLSFKEATRKISTF